MSNKISDNPYFEKMRKELSDMEKLFEFLELLKTFGGVKTEDIEKLKKDIENIKVELHEFGNSLDKFNSIYSNLGWISCENLNTEVAELAIKQADEGNISEGESTLTKYYDEETITSKIRKLIAVPELQKRIYYIEKAKEDYLAERYYSCIPILIMMIDGATNDINRSRGISKGFFTTDVDITAWDSLAGHESGLMKLSELFNQNRPNTNIEKITIPFRNGIMHGRELNYDNKIVAAKLWALLFALRDWSVSLRKKKIEEKPIEEKSLIESVSDLKYTLTRSQEFIKLANNWEPRKIDIGKDIPENGTLDDYKEFTPERATVEFLDYINKKNYGFMAMSLGKYSKYGETDKEVAGRLRKLFESIYLINYKFVRVEDLSFDSTKNIIEIEIEYNRKRKIFELCFNWEYVDNNGGSIAIGQKGGKWYLTENYNNKFELLKKELQ